MWGYSQRFQGTGTNVRSEWMPLCSPLTHDKKDQTLGLNVRLTQKKVDDTARNNQKSAHQNRRQKMESLCAGNGDRRPYGGPRPLCSKCNYHHDGPCAPKCHKCHRFGHLGRDCKNPPNVNTRANQRACFKCGAQGHFKKDCPKEEEHNNGVIRLEMPRLRQRCMPWAMQGQTRNTMSSRYVSPKHDIESILFDTGADRSFVSTAFSSRIVITPTALDHDYNVKLADGRIVARCFGDNGMVWLAKYMPFIANITATKDEDKSKEKRLEDVPVVQEFPKVFLSCQGYYSSIHCDDCSRLIIDDFIEGFSKIARTMTKNLTQKVVKFDLGRIQEAAFQLLKSRSCVLCTNLPCLREANISGILRCFKEGYWGAMLMKERKEGIKYEMERRWLELLSDYDCGNFVIHPGKANVVADALSRKEREPPLRVRALGL
ncbi:putative reverse transcriptase domain-containing protein [Tanacetum coccineum]